MFEINEFNEFNYSDSFIFSDDSDNLTINSNVDPNIDSNCCQQFIETDTINEESPTDFFGDQKIFFDNNVFHNEHKHTHSCSLYCAHDSSFDTNTSCYQSNPCETQTMEERFDFNFKSRPNIYSPTPSVDSQYSYSPKYESKTKSSYRKKSKSSENVSKFTKSTKSTSKKSNTNPAHINIELKFNFLIEKFENRQLVLDAYSKISQIDLNFNTGFIFPSIEYLVDNLINRMKQVKSKDQKVNVVGDFIYQVVAQFEKSNEKMIGYYADLLPSTCRDTIGKYAYIFPLSDAYLYQIEMHCVSDNKKKMIEKHLNAQQKPCYIEVLRQDETVTKFQLENKNPIKDSVVLTNHFGFNLFFGLFFNFFFSFETGIEWQYIYQCPLCGFAPSKPKNRKNGRKNSLNKHQKTCPGKQIRACPLTKFIEFPMNCVWVNKGTAIKLMM